MTAASKSYRSRRRQFDIFWHAYILPTPTNSTPSMKDLEKCTHSHQSGGSSSVSKVSRDLKWDRTGRLGVSWQNLPKLEKPFWWFAKKVKFHSSLLAICLDKFLDHKGQHLRWKDVIMFEQPRSSWYELHFILSIHKGKDMSCEVWDTMGSWISWLAGQWICIRFRLLGLCLNSRNPL